MANTITLMEYPFLVNEFKIADVTEYDIYLAERKAQYEREDGVYKFKTNLLTFVVTILLISLFI